MLRAIVGFVFLVAVARTASAEPEFPAAIQDAAHIPCAPPCTLCHTVTPGTAETATKAFALTVLKSGKLVPKHADSLFDVVAKLKDNSIDTDGDGVLDVDELAAGTDPSSARADAEICGPTYGCGAHIAKVPVSSSTESPWLLGGILTFAVLNHLRRRRPQSRARGSAVKH